MNGNRKAPRKLMHSPIVLAVLVILALFLLKAVWDLFGKSRDASVVAEGAKREYEELLVRETAIKESLERLETPAGVEAEIRQKFGVAKEGEEVVVVISNNASTSAKRAERKDGLWQKFLDLFQ